jgi:quercetin dioxygenase-like cupin family protein
LLPITISALQTIDYLMNQNTFLELLHKQEFPAPVLVVRERSLFIDHHSHQYEAIALVLEGQIDINIGGAKKICLAGDTFHLLPKQVHTESTGTKGVKYLVSRKVPNVEEEVVVEELET